MLGAREEFVKERCMKKYKEEYGRVIVYTYQRKMTPKMGNLEGRGFRMEV